MITEAALRIKMDRFVVDGEAVLPGVDGIMLNDFERGEIGPDLFKAACQMGSKAWCQSAGTDPIALGFRALGQGEKPNLACVRSGLR